MGMRRDTLRVALQGGVNLPLSSKLDLNIGYNNSDSVSAWDLDRTTVQNFVNIQPILTNDPTVHLRYSTDQARRWRGLLGASYFYQKLRISQIDFNYLSGSVGTSAGFVPNPSNFTNSKARVPAVYASLEFDILDTLTLTGDVRFQKDKIVNLARGTNAETANETSNTLPRVILSYKPVKDSNFYASYAEGVQPLTLNAGFLSLSAAGQAYVSTILPGISAYSQVPTLKSFEIGAKQRLFDGRLQYTVASMIRSGITVPRSRPYSIPPAPRRQKPGISCQPSTLQLE